MKLKVSPFLHTVPRSRSLVRKGIADGTEAFCGPEHVVIDLTNKCNNTCIACWTRSPLLGENGPDAQWHRQELGTTRILELIDELYHLGTKIIRFTGGGEPFLHAGIFELIHKVKSCKMYCAVTTNFTTLPEGRVSELLASGIDELSVSLWASTADEYVLTHPNQSGVTFNRITQSLKKVHRQKQMLRLISPIRWLKKSIPYVNILNVISNLNYSSVEAMYDFAVMVGSNAIYVAVVDPIEGSTDSLLLTETQRRAVGRACAAVRRKNNKLKKRRQLFLDNLDNFEVRLKQDSAESGHYDRNNVDSIPCYVGWIFCRIMADGHVVPCCRGVHAQMGNIHQRSFSSIWHSNRYNQFRRKAKKVSKSHPYFKAFNCQKTCDNFMHNTEIHNWLSSSSLCK